MSVREKRNGKYRNMLEQGDVYLGSYQVGPTFNGPTSDAGIRIKAIEGKSAQAVSTGKQLFDASKIPSKTMSGVTLTNNGDGSFTIAGSGNIIDTHFSSNKWYLSDISWLKPGILKLNMGGRAHPQFQVIGYMDDENTDRTFSLASSLGFESCQTVITEEIFERTKHVFMIIWGAKDDEITPGTIKPMLYSEGDGTYEPYTGGKAGPQPEYPIPINSYLVNKFASNFDQVPLATKSPFYLRSLPDGTCDEYKDGKIIRRVGRIILDGSGDEDWTKQSDNDAVRYFVTVNGMKKMNVYYNSLICDRLRTLNNHTHYDTEIPSISGYADFQNNYPDQNWIYVLGIGDANIRTWLQEHPLEVLYPLAEPTIEDAPAIPPILPSSAPKTEAWSDSSLRPTITWEALSAGSCALEVQELRKRVEELEKEVLSNA